MIRCKKIISIAMLMVMMSITFSVNAFAGCFDGCCAKSACPSRNSTDTALLGDGSTEQTVDHVSFSFDTQTGTLEVKCRGKMSDYSSLKIPPWDSYKNKIKSINIGNEVTSIGNNAFTECKYVISITIPDSVEEIGNNAFKGCKRLEEVTIPGSVTKIGNNAFTECIGLKSLTYRGKKYLNRKNVLYDCPRLEKINVFSDYTGDTFCGKDISRIKNQ